MKKIGVAKLFSLQELESLTGKTVGSWRKDIRERRIDIVRLGRLVRVPEEEIARLYNGGFVPRTVRERHEKASA